MPAREKTSATFRAAAVVGRGTVESLGEAEFGGFADGCSAGPRYKPVRGELMRRSSRLVNHTASAAQTTSPLWVHGGQSRYEVSPDPTDENRARDWRSISRRQTGYS